MQSPTAVYLGLVVDDMRLGLVAIALERRIPPHFQRPLLGSGGIANLLGSHTAQRRVAVPGDGGPCCAPSPLITEGGATKIIRIQALYSSQSTINPNSPPRAKQIAVERVVLALDMQMGLPPNASK